MLQLSRQPPTEYGLRPINFLCSSSLPISWLFVVAIGCYIMSFVGRKIWSIVSLKRSSSMRGSSFWRRRDDSSRQGFVLTSMSQTLQSLSIKQSNPNSSKQCLRRLGLIFFFIVERVKAHRYFIFWTMSTSKSIQIPFFLIRRLNSEKESMLPSSWHPYSGLFFCTALLVRWMKSSSKLAAFIEQGQLDVRRYPSRKKQTSPSCVNDTQTLMSNLREFIKRGLSMYFWMMKVCDRTVGLETPGPILKLLVVVLLLMSCLIAIMTV